jgi:hypothetical protein
MREVGQGSPSSGARSRVGGGVHAAGQTDSARLRVPKIDGMN